MKNKKHIETWLKEEHQAFTGWDFSYLDGRWEEEPLPWDYGNIVRKALFTDAKLLDMGTGGGEFLQTLNHPYEHTAVTEGWPPNLKRCIENLAPLGVKVYPVEEDNLLPMGDNAFDLAINRHESYDLAEVQRVLKPGGLFITQQVGGENDRSLEEKINLIPKENMDFSLATQVRAFQKQGFSIQVQKEAFTSLRFFDVGAIVFFAKQIPWSFPGFSVKENLEKLWLLQNEIDEQGFVESTQHRFIIAAQNNK